MNAANKSRRTLSATEMHAAVMALAAKQSVTDGPRVLKVEVTMKPVAKVNGENKGGAKVLAQRIGRDVVKAQPKERGPHPVGLLLPGTYSASEYQYLIRDAGRRPVLVPGTDEVVRYPAKPGQELGEPKMVVDAAARITDQILAISGFCGYFLPHMDGSKEAGPHGAQLAHADRQAFRLVSTGRGGERMSHGSFPLPTTAATTKAHTRCGTIVAGYVRGMPDADRKLILDLLKREELTAFNFRMHEAKADEALTRLEADLEGKDAAALDKFINHHETMREVERQRLVEIRRQLASKGVKIAETMLERDSAGEGVEELSAPSDNTAEQSEWLPEDGAHADETTEELYEGAALCGTEPLPTAEKEIQAPFTVDEDGCIIESELSIEAQIEALKAANAKLRGEEPAPKSAPQAAPVVQSALDTDAALLAELSAL